MHKMTKATSISPQVKRKVLDRDKVCIICKREGIPNAHYIRRSQGGMGVEKNIITLCLKCHNDFDNGAKRKEYGALIRDYLCECYPDWKEEDVIYNKWREYETKR